MKTFLKRVSILVVGVLVLSCSSDSSTPSTPAPTVDFLYSGANNPAPSTVSFTSKVSNATNYLWDFGDNVSSTLANPQHLYTSGGVYTVKLTVSGAGGTTSTTKTVNIGTPLTNVKISKVTIVNIPFTKPGGTSGWDTDGTGPDVFFQIQDQNSTVLFDQTSAGRANNITPSMLPIAWNITNPFVITNLTQSRFIQLFDYDVFPFPNEDLGYVGFLMSSYTTGSNAYPSTVTQTDTTYGLTVKLDLIWY